jgi:hypothetical protein
VITKHRRPTTLRKAMSFCRTFVGLIVGLSCGDKTPTVVVGPPAVMEDFSFNP